MAYYDDIIIVNSQIKCILCSIVFQDDDVIIENHVYGNDHKELEVRRMLSHHSIIDSMDNTFYCRICEINVGNHVKDHLRNRDHRVLMKKVRDLVKGDGSFLKLPKTPNDKEVYCIICDRKFDYNIILLKDHIKSPKHRRARAVTIQPFNGMFSVEGDNKYIWCKFCQKYIDNYIEVIFDHIDGSYHIYNVAKILNLIKDENISIEKYLLDPKEDRAWCLKCETFVACNAINLDSHVKGKMHRK